MDVLRRLLPLATALVAVTTAVIIVRPDPTAAHGGTRVLHTDAGPYRVEAFVTREASGIDESVILSDIESGRPVTNAGRPGLLLNLFLVALLLTAVLLVPRLGRLRRSASPAGAGATPHE